ncbi:pilus assembly protein [Sphingomonas sp. NSE70-1]|uniref:Pilus assembly protein n=1 Tax=Sphingomonas caseinilyticus TaxID=2908205 RepID=A0ABT0RVS3_9SPHN|nr:TadE/TadG family type IV pilus assembly protein [Sphingomonas caseinilyticus]MCL6698911.1 pilus assembly protein [Sphingomonas caseinilyticus]
MRRLLLDRTASSAAEFALVLPLLILFLLGIIDGGRYLWEVNKAEKATQAGARVAIVTDVISTGLGTQGYVGVGGLTQGDLIPASALSDLVCTRTACTCTGNCPTNFATTDSASFDRIVARMQLMMPNMSANNVTITYRGSGLGFAGDPNGMEIAPLVTVQLSNIRFKPLVLFNFATITLPPFRTTLTSEDSSGTVSN